MAGKEMRLGRLTLLSATFGLGGTLHSLIKEGPTGPGIFEMFLAVCFFLLFVGAGLNLIRLRRRSQQ